MTKYLWEKKMVWNVEKFEVIGDEQFGSRPHKACIDVVMRKMLTFLYAHQTHTWLITLDNDATSCFDRQLTKFFSIVCQPFGLPKHACCLFLEICCEIHYHVKTNNGISEVFYKHCKDFLIFGSVQGNGASAPIWLVVTVILMKVF